MSNNLIFENCIQKISDFIYSDENLTNHKKEKHFVRKRLISMFQICMYLLYSSRASIFQNLSCIRDDLSSLDFHKISKQALSKAHQGILPTLFQALFKITVHTFYENVTTTKNWYGYKIFAVDGSKIEVGNSKSNLEYLGCMFDPKNPKRIYSGALASILYDVLDDVIVDASIHKFLFSEREAAKNHLKVMDTLNITQKSIIIFDRGYYSEEMIQYCLNQGLYCLFRIKEGLNIAKQCDGDIITYTNGNTKKGLKPMKIREISVLLDSGTTEYLATNIMDETITPMMFKELYFKRWKVESKYYEIKELLLMEEFNGTTTISINQEFFITMMYSNLSSFVKSYADSEIEKKADQNAKYNYQANRSFILGRIKKIFPKILLDNNLFHYLEDLYQDAIRNKSQVQPNRKNERKSKRFIKRTHHPNRKTIV